MKIKLPTDGAESRQGREMQQPGHRGVHGVFNPFILRIAPAMVLQAALATKHVNYTRKAKAEAAENEQTFRLGPQQHATEDLV